MASEDDDDDSDGEDDGSREDQEEDEEDGGRHARMLQEITGLPVEAFEGKINSSSFWHWVNLGYIQTT